MAFAPRWQRRVLLIAAIAVAGAVAWLWLGREPVASEPSPAPVEIAEAPADEAPADDQAPAPSEPEAEAERELHPPLLPEGGMEEPVASATIDLEAARKALPDNLYWETAAPTQDPRLLGDRERAKTYWNVQFGKVLAGDATEEEIKAFFDHRMQVSSDSVRFVDWVIEHQGEQLSDQDLGLLHVAKRLHLARLEEIPRRMQEAFERKTKQDAAREAWLADERELDALAAEANGEETPPAPDDAPEQGEAP